MTRIRGGRTLVKNVAPSLTVVKTNGALETYGRFMEGAVVAALREKPTRGAVTTGHDILLRPVRTLLYAALSTGSGMLDSHSLAIDASM